MFIDYFSQLWFNLQHLHQIIFHWLMPLSNTANEGCRNGNESRTFSQVALDVEKIKLQLYSKETVQIFKNFQHLDLFIYLIILYLFLYVYIIAKEKKLKNDTLK